MGEFINGECLEEMKKLPESSISVGCLRDRTYGSPGDSHQLLLQT